MKNVENKPSHYCIEGLPECRFIYTAILKNSTWGRGNPIIIHYWISAFCYIFRAPNKGNFKEDIQKAVHYLNWILQELED